MSPVARVIGEFKMAAADMMTDLRCAFRQLLKSVRAGLALGIVLNTAIFSLINDLFLRGL